MYDMIIQSNNFTTNIMIDKVGAKLMRKNHFEMGTKKWKVLRGVEDNKAYQVVWIIPLRLLRFDGHLRGIAKHEAVDSTSSAEMIKNSSWSKFNDIIPAKLPTDVKWRTNGLDYRPASWQRNCVLTGRKKVCVGAVV